MLITYSLGFAAGFLSLLAPCVLPLIPIVFGSSIRSSKWGPFANALGLAISFTLFGLLTSIFSHLFDVEIIQKIGAYFLLIIGFLFITPVLKIKLTQYLALLSRTGMGAQNRIKQNGVISEFLMGCTLGMIWGPCSGPTLGFAFGLASQGENILESTVTFFSFGIGAGLGLIALGKVLRQFRQLTGIILKRERYLNFSMGGLSIALSLIIIFDQLPAIEEWILSISPNWLINLSSSI